MRRRYDRRYSSFEEEEANAMAGVSNLADVMLVLAVGIMLALVINWKINVGNKTVSTVKSDQMKEMDESELGSAAESADAFESNEDLEERGTIYVDRTTGKMYMVEPGD